VIIILSDDKLLLDALNVAIDEAIPVRQETDPDRYIRWARTSPHHVSAMIVDCRTDSFDALTTIDRLGRLHRTTPLVAVVPRNDPDLVYRVGQSGVSNWIPVPFSSVIIRNRLLAALRLPPGTPAAAEMPDVLSDRLIGVSLKMQALRSLVLKTSRCRLPVMIVGETGVGKELVARSIHDASDVADGPFVATNMAAVSSSLFESELFGARHGAFTGASDRPGLFQASSGGSFFLDEITELAPDLQPKLLRAVESQRVRRVGAHRAEKVESRIISATNRRLDFIRRTGIVRQDLWYRLAGAIIAVPPLRDRLEDVSSLAHAFLQIDGYETRLAASALRVLTEYAWPGNVRELRAVILRSAMLAGKSVLTGRDIDLGHP
jgi:two-component system, NtrC family, response regulator PilR